ncbi:DUF5750 family protein [Methanobrevibacter sp.]|uniref:DUF5750 family protein n=1 Tax=Methanobrevibacter sp. TaxID=66852 RepID=UPI00260E20D3|nr:DUF5750 family protein [uncultured Methanobrevibacter sp.]
MEVKVKNYGLAEKLNEDDKEMAFVNYEISGLDLDSINFLKENLEGEIKVEGSDLFIKIFYDEDMSPFHSEESKLKIEDFIAREEIEMKFFISSFLEDKE